MPKLNRSSAKTGHAFESFENYDTEQLAAMVLNKPLKDKFKARERALNKDNFLIVHFRTV